MKDRDGIKFHHLTIPFKSNRHERTCIAPLKPRDVTVIDSPYGIHWESFFDTDFPELVKQQPHAAFEVDNMAFYLKDEEILVPPYTDISGSISAFISVLGMPVKLMQSGAKQVENPIDNGRKGLRYHHIGMPSNGHWEGEVYVPHLQLAYLPGNLNTYGVEWLRFGEGNQSPEIIKNQPHIAFEVDNIEEVIVGEKVIYHSGRDTPGIVVAMIEVDGISVEFLELDRSIVGDKYNG
ncbi:MULTISPECIES: hypothetical protein [Pseudomonas fluorescens group]|uniref:hypothetical protein n=1 Tax=Pseudomonas fluorescens group TaxID=136843 RepID=UPI000699188D|nr:MULTISPECIES: hypothetical protein [Pseudomonas fluorescens group]